MDNIETYFTKCALGMGVKFGVTNLHWIKQYLKLEYPEIEFQINKNLNDIGHLVCDDFDEFKIPFFSENPLIICEVNSVLMKLKEIKRLLRIIEFFKETKNQTFQEAYYFVNKIKTKVLQRNKCLFGQQRRFLKLSLN